MDEQELFDDEFDSNDFDFILDDEEQGSGIPGELEDPVNVNKKDDQQSIASEAVELAKVKAEFEALKAEKEALEIERENLAIQKEEADRITVQSAINQHMAQVKREKEERRELMISLEESRANNDLEAIKKISRAIGAKDDIIDTLQNDIASWQPLLTNRITPKIKPAAKEQKVDQGAILGAQWRAENPWVEDPKFKDKKEKAISIYNRLVADGYDQNKLIFWTHITNELKEFDQSKQNRRTQPATRPIAQREGKTMSTTSGGKKKYDPEVAEAALAALKRAGIRKEDPSYKAKLNSYYRTAERFKEREIKKHNG